MHVALSHPAHETGDSTSFTRLHGPLHHAARCNRFYQSTRSRLLEWPLRSLLRARPRSTAPVVRMCTRTTRATCIFRYCSLVEAVVAASRTRPRFFFCIFSCIRASHRSDVLVSNLLFPPAHLPSFRFIVRPSFAAPRTTTQSRYSSNSSWHLGSSCPFKNSSVYQWLKHFSYLFFNDAHGSSSFLGSFSSAIVSHRPTSTSLFLSSMVHCFGSPKGEPECPSLSASPFAPRGRGVSLTLAGKGGRFPREETGDHETWT